MTAAEQASLNELKALVNSLRTENANFRADIKAQVEAINTKVEAKHMPIQFENDILRNVQIAVGDSIVKALTAYDSPLVKLTNSVISGRTEELRKIITDTFDSVIRAEEFKASILNGFSHKVARTIISNNDGIFDKVSNELKQDVKFKAKLTMAVANVVEDCLKERKAV